MPWLISVILVTGAYGGLGEAAAKACAQAGATVVLLGRKVPKLSRTYDAVKALGNLPAIYPARPGRRRSPPITKRLADTIAADLGGLHGTCIARGLNSPACVRLEATPPEDFVRQPACQPDRALAADPGLPAPAGARRPTALWFSLPDDLKRVNRAYWGTLRRGQGWADRTDAYAARRNRCRHVCASARCSRGPMRSKHPQPRLRRRSGIAGSVAWPLCQRLRALVVGGRRRPARPGPELALGHLMTTVSAALLLFLILDPLGNIPVFLSLLTPLPARRRRIVLMREMLIAPRRAVRISLGRNLRLADDAPAPGIGFHRRRHRPCS